MATSFNRDFSTQSELIEPVLPQAGQLCIHFFFYSTQLEMHLLEGSNWGNSTGEVKLERIEEEEKTLAPIWIWTHDLLIMRCVLYHCAIKVAHLLADNWWDIGRAASFITIRISWPKYGNSKYEPIKADRQISTNRILIEPRRRSPKLATKVIRARARNKTSTPWILETKVILFEDCQRLMTSAWMISSDG